MAGAVGGLAAGGAARGIFSAITEIIDEAGDLLETIANNLKEFVLVDKTIEKMEKYPCTSRRKHMVYKKTIQRVKITAWDLVLIYAFGRVMGWWGPIVDWRGMIGDKLSGLLSWWDTLTDLPESTQSWLASLAVQAQERAAAEGVTTWSWGEGEGERSRTTDPETGETTVELGWGGKMKRSKDKGFEMGTSERV